MITVIGIFYFMNTSFESFLKDKSLRIILAVYILFTALFPILLPSKADAANFTQAYLRLDRVAATTATGGMVCAKPATTGTEFTVQVAFPGGYTVNSTASNWTVTTTNLPGGNTAWTGIGTATSVSSGTVTFPSGDLIVGSTYCFNFSATNTLTTGTAGDNQLAMITTRTTTPTTLDQTTVALSVISNDQVTVSATVSPLFSFALSGNTMALGTLSTGSVTSSTTRTITIGTNAGSGWIAFVKSANGYLSSVSTSGTIPSPGTINDTPESLAGQAGYVLGVTITTDSTAGTGTVSQAASYGAEYVDTSNQGGHLDTVFQPIAASSGTTDADVLTVTAKAKISAVQPAAADYTDTLTFVGAGRF